MNATARSHAEAALAAMYRGDARAAQRQLSAGRAAAHRWKRAIAPSRAGRGSHVYVADTHTAGALLRAQADLTQGRAREAVDHVRTLLREEGR